METRTRNKASMDDEFPGVLVGYNCPGARFLTAYKLYAFVAVERQLEIFFAVTSYRSKYDLQIY